MKVTLKTIISFFNAWAPDDLALKWDNVGLQIGDPNQEISEIIVANSQDQVSVELPLTFNLSEAYPNPFNPTTTLELYMSNSGEVHVEIYNIMGQLVTTLVSGYIGEGLHQLSWNASDASSGLYLVKAYSEGINTNRKIMLIK